MRTKPMAFAILSCVAAVVLHVVLSALLMPEAQGEPRQGMVWPERVMPDIVVILLMVAWYPVVAVVLYRARVHLVEPARLVATALMLALILVNVSWNPLLTRLENPGHGAVIAAGVLVIGYTTLVIVLARRDRISSGVLIPYLLSALYDLWWTRELVRLNPGA